MGVLIDNSREAAMFEDTCLDRSCAAVHYTGPERRSEPPAATRWLACMLDETDHGMLLVTPSGRLRHANQPGQQELSSRTALWLDNGIVKASERHQHADLLHALADASRGRRRLLSVGPRAAAVSVAVVPLGGNVVQAEPLVLLTLGKRQSCEALTLNIYAHSQGLTDAETRVLQAVCRGLRPKEVARQFDVAVSTIRTQISSIRHKTQTNSIRDLVNRVTTLPPITPAMKTMAH
jgi:DNA-binding CsgD family transcriptional regulator